MIKILNGGSDGIYIGRGSFFGNPYKIGTHGDREDVIELYRKNVLPTLVQSLPFRQLVEAHSRGVDLTLRCFCAPLHCHGDVIAETIRAITGTRITRLIIAGSNHLTDSDSDYKRLCDEIDDLNPNEIISCYEKGDDPLVERYAREHEIACRHFPVNWRLHPESALTIRDHAVVRFSSRERGFLLSFVNGVHTRLETFNIIQVAERYGLKNRTVKTVVANQ